MKKNSGIVIAVGIAIAIIITVISINNQESEITEIDEPVNIDFGNDASEIPLIQDKLDEIEKKAEEFHYEPAPRDWPTSGPFQIDRSKYLIGEKIFIVIGGLNANDKGQIAFMRPLNDTHYSVYQTIPFDGMKKNAFNYYLEPVLAKTRGICSIDDIIGEWTVVFRGTDYPNIKFEVINKILPGEEDSFEEPVC